ncbi:uncharacterized protein MELLADRAFT_124363 [Melampsora larici-populina 98AG31]|uniref:Secreted protein n=1 Tax=Melampsora larici-populina (strain 98AG31 / pathotype 3-4-7) TaxID=747676 RepID=F4RMQ4_MELLP|nr:uncharacterized protein MELLADRAFT_124363 [Melampsora larici-populina 98AG31]EGG06149.1 secreted protein [Melampsora larici-populina 98AG31]
MNTVFHITNIVLICTFSAIVQPAPIQNCGGYELTKPWIEGLDTQVLSNGDKVSSFRQHPAHKGDGECCFCADYDGDPPACTCCGIPCCTIV